MAIEYEVRTISRRAEPDAGRGRLRGVNVLIIDMNDQFVVTCPYCGEEVEIYVEPDTRGIFVQDCEVCCNPWRLRVRGRGDERSVEVQRADGSE